MKEIMIPELEEEIKKLPKGKVAFAYTALTKEVLADGE